MLVVPHPDVESDRVYNRRTMTERLIDRCVHMYYETAHKVAYSNASDRMHVLS